MQDVCIARPNSRWSKCRCEACRVRRRRLAKQRNAGILPRITAEQVWAAVDAMTARGWEPKEIATVAGVNYETLRRAMGERRGAGGGRAFVHNTARALLAAEVATRGQQPRYMPIVGTSRRLRALACMGWELRALASMCPTASTYTLRHVRAAEYERVLRTTADEVAALYERLWDKDGGSGRARAQAAREGWVPPMAWDDDEIDDPAAQPCMPDEVNRQRRYRVDLDEVNELAWAGVPLSVIASDMDVLPGTIMRACYRHGRNRLAALLAAEERRLEEATA